MYEASVFNFPVLPLFNLSRVFDDLRSSLVVQGFKIGCFGFGFIFINFLGTTASIISGWDYLV
jgi:hypothetical protein